MASRLVSHGPAQKFIIPPRKARPIFSAKEPIHVTQRREDMRLREEIRTQEEDDKKEKDKRMNEIAIYGGITLALIIIITVYLITRKKK